MDSKCSVALDKHLDNRCEIASNIDLFNRVDQNNSSQPEYVTSQWAVCPECGTNLFPSGLIDQIQTNEDADRYPINYSLCTHLTTASKELRKALCSFLPVLKARSEPLHHLALRLLERPNKEKTTCAHWVVGSMMKVAFLPLFYPSDLLRTYFHPRVKSTKRKTPTSNETQLKKKRVYSPPPVFPNSSANYVVCPLALPPGPSGGSSGGPGGYCSTPFGQSFPEADGSVGLAGVSDDQLFSGLSPYDLEEPLPPLFEGVTQDEGFCLPDVACPFSPEPLCFGSWFEA